MNRLRVWLKDNWQFTGLQAVIVILGIWFRWPTMSYALTEAHAARQTFTTLMIREYMDGGLFQLSPLPLFGPPWQLPTEFPLFQWIAAVGGDLVGTTPQIAGRLTALVFFVLTSLLATYLAARWFSRTAAVVTLVLFQVLPFAYQWGNAPLIEFLATSGALLAIVAVVKWNDQRAFVWLTVATLAFVVAFLVKPTTAIVWLPVYVGAAVSWTGQGFWAANRGRVLLGLPALIGLVSGIGWNRFSDGYKTSNTYTEWLATSNLHDWYYGTIDQRLDSSTWQMIFSYSEAIYGSLTIFVVLLVAGLFVWPNRAHLVGLALALPVGALIFTNVFYMHNYYQSAVLPALVMILGAGVAALARLAAGIPAKTSVVVVGLLTVVVVAWLSGEGKLVSERKVAGLYDFPVAAEMAAVVPPGAGVIMVGCDWDSTYFYLSGRRGLMVRDDQLAHPVPPEWLGKDLTYLASCNPAIDPTPLFPAGTALQPVSASVSKIVLPN